MLGELMSMATRRAAPASGGSANCARVLRGGGGGGAAASASASAASARTRAPTKPSLSRRLRKAVPAGSAEHAARASASEESAAAISRASCGGGGSDCARGAAARWRAKRASDE
jgi:hypothetical protein